MTPCTPGGAAVSPPAAPALRVAVAGGGPGGLGCAIGLARQGHEVHVFERLDTPVARGLVSRERSYPVAVAARGMHALDRLGAAGPHSAVRRRMAQRADFPFDALVGSRDALVQGLLEHIEESQEAWPGSVHVYHCCGVVGVDLSRRTLDVAPGSATPGTEAAARAFDLICACDGRNSPVRASAASQDPSLEVSQHEDWNLYKTINVDRPGGLAQGIMYKFDRVHVAVLPDGTAMGRVPVGKVGMTDAGRGCTGVGQLRQLGLHELLTYVSAEEEAAFDSRRICSAGGGSNASRLVAGSCVVLLGDAATSYVEDRGGRGGANHALDMAASFVESMAARGGASLEEVLVSWSEARMPDELAYSRGQLGRPWETAPYRELSAKGKGKGKKGAKGGRGKGADGAQGQAEPGEHGRELHSWGQTGWTGKSGARGWALAWDCAPARDHRGAAGWKGKRKGWWVTS